MKTNKQIYEHPETSVLELRTQGILCQSGMDGSFSASRDGYGSSEGNTYTWGN